MLPNNPFICCFGEVLWDLLPSGKQMGGAPMNVAAHLEQLGMPSLIISRVGNDDLGNEIKAWLNWKKFSTQYIETDEMHATGVVNVHLADKTHATYEIVYPVAWDFITVTDEIVALAEHSLAMVFGTLACRNAVSRASLFKLLEKASLKVFDVNLRSPHYSQELVESLLHHADIVKMNDDELHLISSWYGMDEKNDLQKMEYLKSAFKLQMLLVTRGARGSLLLNDSGMFESEGFKVHVMDTIGSGDSFLAGFLKKYTEGKPMQEALTYASAIGALVATHRGAIPSISEDEILRMMSEL